MSNHTVPSHLLCLFHHSWGAADWILPVLTHHKEHIAGSHITAACICDSMEDFLGDNTCLRELTENVVDEFIFHPRLKQDILYPKPSYRLPARFALAANHHLEQAPSSLSRLPAKVLRKAAAWTAARAEQRLSTNPRCYPDAVTRTPPFQVLLRDLCGTPTDPFSDHFRRLAQERHAAEVIYPATTDFYFYTAAQQPRNYWQHDADAFLCNAQIMADNFASPPQDGRNQRVIAIPRYDRWWIDRLVQWHQHAGEAKALVQQTAGKKPVLLLIRGPGNNILTEQDYDFLMTTAVQQVLEDPNAFLMIKPHPRQTREEVERYLPESQRQRCSITSLHTVFLADLAELCISFAVSVMLDVLAVGRPVIEFYRYGDVHTHYTQDWRQRGLVIPADTADELQDAIGHIRGDLNLQQYLTNFRKLVPATDDQMTHIVIDGLAAAHATAANSRTGTTL